MWGHGRLLLGNGPQEDLEEQLDTEVGQWNFKQREDYKKTLLKGKPETMHQRGFIFCKADGSWKQFPADGSCEALKCKTKHRDLTRSQEQKRGAEAPTHE